MDEWRKRLQPYGRVINHAYKEIRDKLEALSDDELEQVIEDASKVTQGNCGWDVYRAARVVKTRGVYIQRSRKREGEADE